jgi:hypothetical protein
MQSGIKFQTWWRRYISLSLLHLKQIQMKHHEVYNGSESGAQSGREISLLLAMNPASWQEFFIGPRGNNICNALPLIETKEFARISSKLL